MCCGMLGMTLYGFNPYHSSVTARANAMACAKSDDKSRYETAQPSIVRLDMSGHWF